MSADTPSSFLDPIGRPCRSCGADLVWGITASGKRMPLDVAPREGGKWLISDTGKIVARPSTSIMGHDSHFATCPQAAQHRRQS